ncbi:uncharacterized protein CLUP02_05667 [Colletotrichum lupini]|uniref:Uncharacterized protein n=1 Tax=Colletotrichum lupini TaxID=145971 RepID=A0A9Q8SNK1_9PEZI|nr:uncharacterized protein CLUP02_05667 [Colletotrichum lupini]UQC80185.1 hypothetical protein CLUP02_05667 [Colletotrichum lupini]
MTPRYVTAGLSPKARQPAARRTRRSRGACHNPNLSLARLRAHSDFGFASTGFVCILTSDLSQLFPPLTRTRWFASQGTLPSVLSSAGSPHPETPRRRRPIMPGLHYSSVLPSGITRMLCLRFSLRRSSLVRTIEFAVLLN